MPRGLRSPQGTADLKNIGAPQSHIVSVTQRRRKLLRYWENTTVLSTYTHYDGGMAHAP